MRLYLIHSWIGLSFVLLFMTSCTSVDDSVEDGLERAGYKSKVMKNLKTDTSDEDYFEKTDNEVVRVDVITDDGSSELQLMKDDLRSPEEDLKSRNKAKPAFYEVFLKDDPDVEKLLPVEINFDSASLIDWVPMFAEKYLNFSYIIDPRVQGKVTMIVNTKLTKREVWQLFERILWLSGAYCSYEDGVIQILPFAKMPQERKILVGHEPQSNVEVQIFYLREATAADIANQLKPFMTEGAQIITLQKNNALLIIEAPANMPKLQALVEMLDKSERSNWPKVAIHCQNISATEIKEELVNLLPVLGYPVTVDKVAAEPGAIHLTSVDRLRVIIASAANTEALVELRRWINILDRDDVGEQERIFVYNVVNNTSDDLLKAIQAIFNTDATSLSAASTTGATPTSSTFEKKAAPKATTATSKTSSSKGGKSGEKGGIVSVFESPIKIFADGIHNRLVIRTTPRTYAMLKALLKRLDTIPAQVLLQVMIAEISLNENTEFGLEYSGLVRHQGINGGSSPYRSLYGTNYAGLTSLTTADGKTAANDQGFNYYLYNKNDPDKFMYIRAMAGNSNTRVLSCPQILAVSHTKAQVKVGDQVPIVTGENQSQDTTNIYRSVQYQDTGIILNLTPHITKGGRVAIDLEQTVSDAVKTTTSDIDSPTIQERKFTTTLSLRNQSTVIVGGMIQERKVESLDGTPVINKLPLVGKLLGYNDIEKKRVELIVLITATIIDETTDLQDQIRRYKNAVKYIDNLEAKVEK